MKEEAYKLLLHGSIPPVKGINRQVHQQEKKRHSLQVNANHAKAN